MSSDPAPGGAARGADHVARALHGMGVRRIFTLSGNHVMPVFDACLDAGLDLLHVRHEAAAVHMADAWGRLTGEPGVALVTGGPGHANAVSALYTARASESPVVLLSGHAPRARLGQGAFQEMRQAEMAAPVTKASWTAMRGEDLAADVRRAFAIAAAGRPGPVHLGLPSDLLEARCEAAPDVDGGEQVWIGDDPDRAAEAVRAAIAGAERPLVLAGPLLLRDPGADGLASLAEALRAPVVASESPRGVNDPALGAFAEVLGQANLLVMLGRPVDFTLGFGQPPAVAAGARFVLLDPEPKALARSRRAIGSRERVAAEFCVEARDLARRLGAGARPAGGDPGWAREVEDAVRHRPPEWAAVRSAPCEPPHPLEVCRAVAPLLGKRDDAVLVIDGGEFGQWAQACLSSPTRLINGPAGAIGSAIPFAIAARAARPGAPVLALLGDGTLGFHLAEYDTAVRYGLGFVGVVGNDARWNAEHQIQLRDYGPDRLVGCDLLPTRYDRVVEAMGGHGAHVTDAAGLNGALAGALGSGLPACVNVSLAGVAAPVVRRARGEAAA